MNKETKKTDDPSGKNKLLITKIILRIKNKKNVLKSSIYAIIGFVLSPISWWNDLFVNIPLAYLFALPFGYISKEYFLPGMIVGYWITNIIGFLLLHKGIIGLFSKKAKKYSKKEFLKDVLISVIYTIVVVLLIYLNIIRLPTEYF